MTSKVYVTIALTILSNLLTNAQDFSGYRSGNYTGVNGVFFNPASIADSRYKVDFNLLSVSGFVGNNQAGFSMKNITKSFDGDSIKNQLFGSSAGPSTGFVSAAVHGPSLLINAGKKMSFALTSRARVVANAMDIDGKLVDKISNDLRNDPLLPYSISTTANMRLAVNGWTEFGLSIARVISDKEKHFFKGGLSVKYLAGTANGYLNIANLNGTLNEDPVLQEPYFSNTTGRITLGFGGARVSNLETDNILNFESSGIGADIGFVYEFRPDYEKYKTENGEWQRDRNKYKLKVGVALLDIGKNAYKRDQQRSGTYAVNITGNERLYTGELNGVGIDDYKEYFNSRPAYFTPDNSMNSAEYKVSLPTTLQIDLDYNLHKNLYVALASQLGVSNSSAAFKSRYYNMLTLTPRYEGKGIGLSVPINYNGLTKFNMGTSFRLGPLFFGSGSVLSALFGESKQVDAHFGLRFGSLQ
jgi:hypothetical protein